MDDPNEITISSVAKFLEDNGGQSTNHELVSHFRKLLNDSSRKDVFRLKFKDIVNSIASVHEENGSKYICLKPQYFKHSSCSDLQAKSVENQQYPQSYQPYWRYRLSFNANLPPPTPLPTTVLSHYTSQEENYHPSSNVALHNRRRSMHDVEINRNDSCKLPTRTRSRSLFNNESNIATYNPVLLQRNSSLTENTIIRDVKRQAAVPLAQSLPESVNTCFINKPRDNRQFQPCSSEAYVVTKSPTRRPAPLCLSDDKLDSLLRDQSNNKDFFHSDSLVNLHSTVDNAQSKNDIPDFSTTSSPSKVYYEKFVPPEQDCENNYHISNDSQLSVSGNSTEVNLETEDVSHSCSVRERAQIIDTIAAASNTSNIQPKRTPSRISNTYRTEKPISEDTASVISLDSKLKRQWFIKASKADYHGLVSLLKKEPRLAGLRDIASGFTALHWAAKHGNAEVVKLIAGTHKISPNLKSNGGYTCIHLATLYKHKAIVDLLLKTYGANPTIRDNSGKRADQYPENYVTFTVGITRKPPKPAAITAASPSSLDRKNRMLFIENKVEEPKQGGKKRRSKFRQSLRHSLRRRQSKSCEEILDAFDSL